jgi:hypothetical protein
MRSADCRETKDWIEEEITQKPDKYGDVPPLWMIFPAEHHIACIGGLAMANRM